MHGIITQSRNLQAPSRNLRPPRPVRAVPRLPAPDPRPGDLSAGLLSPAEIRALVREWLG